MKKYFVLLICIVFVAIVFGQTSAEQYKKLSDEGLELLKQQNIPASIDKYRLAFEMDSNKVEANYGLGVAYLYTCQKEHLNCDKALYFLNKAIKIDHSYRNGYFNRGQCKGTIGNYKGAMADFSETILQNPNDAAAYFCRALIKIKLNDGQGACEDLYSSISLGNETARTMFEANCGVK